MATASIEFFVNYFNSLWNSEWDMQTNSEIVFRKIHTTPYKPLGDFA